MHTQVHMVSGGKPSLCLLLPSQCACRSLQRFTLTTAAGVCHADVHCLDAAVALVALLWGGPLLAAAVTSG